MGKVIPFPNIKLEREEQAFQTTDSISLELLNLLEKYNIDTTRESFIYDSRVVYLRHGVGCQIH